MYIQECKNRIGFIRFKSEKGIKWCHARIENETDSTIEFRTTPNGNILQKKKVDIQVISDDEAKRKFTEDEIWKLYRGEILAESSESLGKN